MRVEYWVDGGMLGPKNPCPAGVFWSVYERLPGEIGEIVVSRKPSRVHTTNNEAEWLALLEALAVAQRHKHSRILIQSDSQLVVNQFNRRYRIHKPHLARLADAAWIMASAFVECKVKWVPRKEMVMRLGH